MSRRAFLSQMVGTLEFSECDQPVAISDLIDTLTTTNMR